MYVRILYHIYIPISTYLLCMYMFDLYYISTYLYSVYIYTYIYGYKYILFIYLCILYTYSYIYLALSLSRFLIGSNISLYLYLTISISTSIISYISSQLIVGLLSISCEWIFVHVPEVPELRPSLPLDSRHSAALVAVCLVGARLAASTCREAFAA
jgi:hypothetical protein